MRFLSYFGALIVACIVGWFYPSFCLILIVVSLFFILIDLKLKSNFIKSSEEFNRLSVELKISINTHAVKSLLIQSLKRINNSEDIVKLIEHHQDRLNGITARIRFIGRSVFHNNRIIPFEKWKTFEIGQMICDCEKNKIFVSNEFDSHKFEIKPEKYLTFNIYAQFNYSFLVIWVEVGGDHSRLEEINTYFQKDKLILFCFPLLIDEDVPLEVKNSSRQNIIDIFRIPHMFCNQEEIELIKKVLQGRLQKKIFLR